MSFQSKDYCRKENEGGKIMANYFCTDSVEEQVDYLTDKVKDLNTNKLDKAAIVQVSGTGTDVVMSQDAVTKEIAANQPTAEKLHEVIKGTSTVTVDLSEDQQTLNVALDKSQEVQYVELTPSTATNDTLTEAQWTTLQLNKENCITLNNEIYRLADNQHTTGIVSYVHTGWDGTAMKDKSINITVSTRAWTLVAGTQPSGGKLYNHAIYYSLTDTNLGYTTIYINIITSSSTPFTKPSEFTGLISRKVATIMSQGFAGTAVVNTAGSIIEIHGGGTKLSDPNAYATINLTLDSSIFRTDTVTEL